MEGVGRNQGARTPLPGSLPGETGSFLDFGSFTVRDLHLLSSDGGSGLVYDGYSDDFYGTEGAAAARLIVKECFPLECASWLMRQGDSVAIVPSCPSSVRSSFDKTRESYAVAFARHTAMYQGRARSFTSIPGRILQTNGTVYLASDVSDARTASEISFTGIAEKIGAVCAVCDAVEAVHESGFACLDIKPSNVLLVPGGEGGYSRAHLFDFDTAIPLDQSAAETPDGIRVSGGWSAFELTHPDGSMPDFVKADLYSVGAFLFWLLVGQHPTDGEVIHAFGDWDVQAVAPSLGGSSAALLKRILDATLTVDPADRFDTAAELGAELRRLRDMVVPLTPMVKSAMDQLGKDVTNQIEEANKVTRAHIWRDRAIWVVIGALLAALAAASLLLSNHAVETALNKTAVGTWYGDLYAIITLDEEAGVSNGSFVDMAQKVVQLEITEDVAVLRIGEEAPNVYELQDMGGSYDPKSGNAIQSYQLVAAGIVEGSVVIYSKSIEACG